MHGSLAANARLLDALKAGLKHAEGVDCAVCAPFPYLAQVSAALSGSRIAWGAQDVSEHDAGAYTGEVSGAMLKEFGCRFAIVGHSERRSLYGEDDSRVAAKLVAAQRAGLTPILCVGETLEERERGETENVVGRQLDAVLAAAGSAAPVPAPATAEALTDLFSRTRDRTEALAGVVSEFADAVAKKRNPLTDAAAGVRVVSLLEAAEQSLRSEGRRVKL